MSNGKLDSPVLDDRTWQDIVDEAKTLIPIYAPDWTDHNPSDLGITLIELFAWIVEGMIYRLNRVPEKNFIEFLNLLGITRDPATPASTFLTYSLAPGTSPTLVPKGSLAATQQTEKEEGVVFETDADLKVLPINLTTALFIKKTGGVVTYQNVTPNLISSPFSKYTLSIPDSESVMITLGFDSVSAEETSLIFGFDKTVKKDNQKVPIEINWLYPNSDTAKPTLTGESWRNISEIIDGTNVFQKNGKISLKVPSDWVKQNHKDWSYTSQDVDKIDQSLFWIGIRIKNLRQNVLNLDLRHILFNSVSATNAITITQPEPLGVSNGKNFQSFELKNRPLFKRPWASSPYDHLIIQVGPTNEIWKLCDNFEKGLGNYFRLNPVTGTISFGSHDPVTLDDHGTIPPSGSAIRAQTYRYVIGGAKSNVPPNTVNSMRTYIAGVTSVTNPVAAKGGSDEEDIEETKRRGPEMLRNRNRAVTLEDYEYLAKETSADVVKVRALPPRLVERGDNTWDKNAYNPWMFANLDRSPGRINVIIVPSAPENVSKPQPEEDLIQKVSDYLNDRRVATSILQVSGPKYLPIDVIVKLGVWNTAKDKGLIVTEDQVRAEIIKKINRFLHPLFGNVDGNGWEIGEHIFISNLFKFIMPDPEIGLIEIIQVKAHEPPDYHDDSLTWSKDERPYFLDGPGVRVRLADYELICSGKHDVRVEFKDG